MSKTTQTVKLTGRSVDLFLKKDSDFSQDSTLALVKNISAKTHMVDPKTGETVDIKNMELMEMVNRNLKRVGTSGWHAFHEAFDQCFTSNHDDSKFSGEGSIIETLEEAFARGNDGNVWTDCADRQIRSVSVGDVFSVNEWKASNGESDSPRFFVVAKTGFIEFNRATGELI